MSEALVRLNLKTEEVKRLMREQIDLATRQTFQLDILPEAIQNSPVTPEGMAYNQATFDAEPHKPGTKIDPVKLKGTGHNRQSLEVTFDETPSGTQATLFTQSGYGGYLELGTSKMRAQPYIWPAFLKFYQNIVDKIKV